MQRPHWLYLFYDTKKWLILLLLPVLRAIFSNRDTLSVIVSSLRDIFLACLLIFYSVMKWQRTQYSLHNGLTYRHGLIYQRTLRVMADDAASIEVERTPMMWLSRGRRIRINTAGLRKQADATIYLPASVTQTMINSVSGRRGRRYSSQVIPVVIMSASNSNAALGLLTLAPAIRQTGQILGREFSELYGLMNRIIYLGLPPLLDATANILVIGWCYAFIRTFARTAGFFTERDGQQLHLISGMLTRRDTYIDCSRITTLELRQTLFMRLFQLYTVTITAAGYGREKGSRPVIIPAARPKELCYALDILLPEYPTCAGMLRPAKKALFGYTWLPLLVTLCSVIPLFFNTWNMLSAIWFIFGAWWLSIRITSYTSSGFGVNGHAVTMRYSRGLALYEIHVPLEVADCAIITRSPWQRINGTCTVELRCFGEKRRRHRVSILPYEPACMLANKLMKIKGE